MNWFKNIPSMAFNVLIAGRSSSQTSGISSFLTHVITDNNVKQVVHA
jgi:hypothetical protein